MIKELLTYETTHFVCLAVDGTEARKTREEKELVYAKFLAMDGRVTITWLLNCFRMRDFGGLTADATFDVMKREAKSMLLIVCADGVIVNFGRHNGALNQLKEWVGHLLRLMHCPTHRIELGIKDAFEQNKSSWI